MRSDKIKLQDIIKLALEEDCYRDDITSKSLMLYGYKSQAVIKANQDGVCAGMNVVSEIFRLVDKKLKFIPLIKDGSEFEEDQVIAKITGLTASILLAERTVLNFLSRLSGIATITRAYVNKVRPHKARIMDTRKTTPGLRILEKYAVRMGGGYNHRYDLAETILIKDNHIAALRKKDKNIDLGSIVKLAKEGGGNKEIEIEVTDYKEFQQAFNASPDIIMLDNMEIPAMKQCIEFRNVNNSEVKLEVSGNVSLETVKRIASLGVDRISIGRLTHSPKSIDMSLDFV